MTTKKQSASKRYQSDSMKNGEVYEIKIQRHLDEHWKQWFDGMELGNETNGETGQECTLIIGTLADQPALHGLLAKIRDLNLTLISVRKLNLKDPDNKMEDHDDTLAGIHRRKHS